MFTRFLMLRRGAAAYAITTLALGASGCAVGPTYEPPAAPNVASLSPQPITTLGKTGANQQRFVSGLELPRRWWELFGCRELEAVVARAVERNPDIEAAKAAVRVADANMRAAGGALFPQVGASAGSSKQAPGASQGTVSSPYTISSGQVTVSYALDVFGLNRRRVEALAANGERQRFELEAAYLTLTARLVMATIEEASLREQIKAAEEVVTVASSTLAQLKMLLAAQQTTKTDVAAQDAALAHFQQSLYKLRKQLAANRDLTTALTGGFAGEPIAETFSFSCLHLPKELPRSLPSDVVQRRPDVRAAAASVHQATAEIGVAVANRFPQITFNANVGGNVLAMTQAATLGPALLWSVAGNLAQPLFDGMTLEQRQRAAEAGLDQTLAQYRSVVITAFQTIADVLQAMDADADAMTAAERGAQSSSVNLALTRDLLTRGEVNVLQVLSAQQSFAQARSNLAQARAARLLDTVLLFQALGGGLTETTGSRPRPKGWITNVRN